MELALLIQTIIAGTVETLQVLQAASKMIRDAQARGEADISPEDKIKLEQMYQASRANVDAAIAEAVTRERVAGGIEPAPAPGPDDQPE